mmetsp:Transcript_8406/g.52571  ORF Transcript_8406/g.52571 Transcript_8406/m.52571 type:complete len:316 (+) Transcript_8406:1900-2847(+)
MQMKAFKLKPYFLFILLGLLALVFILHNGRTSKVISERSRGVRKRSALGKDSDLPRLYKYRVLNVYNHDPFAFTQGLLHEKDDMLLESTGHYGRSTVRRVDLKTGKPIDVQNVPKEHFAEGLHLHDGALQLLTWRTPLGMRFDSDTLAHVGNFSTGLKDGWGLTGNGTHVVATDSGSTLFYLNPTTLFREGEVPVTFHGRPVRWLNELEFIEGEVWANVFMRDCIARIDPDNGNVLGWVLLQGLRQNLLQQGGQNRPGVDVLNGIAWDPARKRIFVTGKYWPELYEVELYDAGTIAAEDTPEIIRVCMVPEKWNI